MPVRAMSLGLGWSDLGPGANWGIVIAGFFTGGALAVRGGYKAARNSAIGCACLLAVIEGVGIGFQRMMAENTRLEVYFLFLSALQLGLTLTGTTTSPTGRDWRYWLPSCCIISTPIPNSYAFRHTRHLHHSTLSSLAKRGWDCCILVWLRPTSDCVCIAGGVHLETRSALVSWQMKVITRH